MYRTGICHSNEQNLLQMNEMFRNWDSPLPRCASSPYNGEMASETNTELIYDAVANGRRIDMEEARWLWNHASNDELRRLATIVRNRFVPTKSCTYMIMRIINYTNVCVA